MSEMEKRTWITKHLLSQSHYNSYIWFFLRKSFAPLFKCYCYAFLQLSLRLFIFFLKYIYYFYILLISQKASENVCHRFTSFYYDIKGKWLNQVHWGNQCQSQQMYPLLLNPKFIRYPLLVVTLPVLLPPHFIDTCAHACIFRHHSRDDTGIDHLKRTDANQIFKCLVYTVCISSGILAEMSMSLKRNWEGY